MVSRVVLSQPNYQHSGSIARSAKRRYLNYSVGDFEVFRPIRVTRYTDGVEIWHAKFHPIRAMIRV